ncbi:MAG: nucleotidyltransferase family protein [Parvularcula sp.]
MSVDRAMVLAAGLGTRFRDVSGDLPKPLVSVAGRPLIDWTLNMLADSGVTEAVVNVHYKADLVEQHLSQRTHPHIVISDERGELLETGGGLVKATPMLGADAIFCSNTDAIFDPSAPSPAAALAAHWDDDAMDALLMLAPLDLASGYTGAGDFELTPDGRLQDRNNATAFVFTGLQIIHPRLWAGQPEGPMSTRVFWDKARAEGRAYGLVHSARWMHVGDPEGFEKATQFLGATP